MCRQFAILESSERGRSPSRGRRGVLVCGRVAVPDLSAWEPGTVLGSACCLGAPINNAPFTSKSNSV